MAIRFQLRRGTAALWTSTDPVLAEGELGLETDTGFVKAGDGTTAWTDLSYISRRTTDDLPESATKTFVFLTDVQGGVAVGTGLRNVVHTTGETGYDNTAIGVNAGNSLTSGHANTLVGYNAGRDLGANTTTSTYGAASGNVGNTLIGRNCAAGADGALDNTLVGVNAGQNLSTGMDNAGIGINVLAGIEGGSENAACGHGALQYVVGSGEYAAGTGHRLSALGDMAGRFLAGGSSTPKTAGKNSLYLGARTASGDNAAVNETVIGPDAEGEGSNTVVIGNADVTQHFLKGALSAETAAPNVYRDPATGELKETSQDYSDWVPEYSATSGAFTTVTTNSARYKRRGKEVSFTIDFTITDAGTAGSALFFSPPVAAAHPAAFAGFENSVIGEVVLAGFRSSELTLINIAKYNSSTTIIGTGMRFIVSGSYEGV